MSRHRKVGGAVPRRTRRIVRRSPRNALLHTRQSHSLPHTGIHSSIQLPMRGPLAWPAREADPKPADYGMAPWPAGIAESENVLPYRHEPALESRPCPGGGLDWHDSRLLGANSCLEAVARLALRQTELRPHFPLMTRSYKAIRMPIPQGVDGKAISERGRSADACLAPGWLHLCNATAGRGPATAGRFVDGRCRGSLRVVPNVTLRLAGLPMQR